MLLLCGFSTLETARTGRLFGDKWKSLLVRLVGTVAVGATMRGTVSGCAAPLLTISSLVNRFTLSIIVVSVTLMVLTVPLVLVLLSSLLANMLKLTLLVLVQLVDSRSRTPANAVKGQKDDALFEVTGLSTTPLVGDALGFTTVGMGYSDNTTYIIRTVTNYDSGTGRATINIAPSKGSAPASLDDQEFLMRTDFSKLRLTGHDFLLIGTGNTSQTNYPNVDENTASQGNELMLRILVRSSSSPLTKVVTSELVSSSPLTS